MHVVCGAAGSLANRHTLLGQNWDWLPFALDTAVVLEVHRDDLPSYITIAEAGHFAKVGFNAAGLGMCTNTLVSTRDVGASGVPYHSVLRALMDATTLSNAMRTVYADRARSRRTIGSRIRRGRR